MTSAVPQEKYVPATDPPEDCPQGLLDALARRSARVFAVAANPAVERSYIRASSPSGELFAWFSRDSCQKELAAYELEIRKLIGSDEVLRSPQPLEYADCWRLDRWIDAKPCSGEKAIETIVESARQLQDIRLPKRKGLIRKQSGWVSFRRRLRVVCSDLATRDYLTARAVLTGSSLPLVTSHGDFHRRHILLEDGSAWVIDWELSGLRPAGFDLLYLWSDLDGEEDRDYLFERTVGMLGESRRKELLRLRFAMLVRMIAAKLADPEPLARDRPGAQRLLTLLPSVRHAAALGSGR